jgi:predicted MFS family arabinose efflux permease
MVSIAIPAAFPGFTALYVAAAGIGTSFTLFHIGIQHAVGEGSSREDLKANFGWLALGFSISNFLGPTSAGLAIDAFGHRATFTMFALLAFAALVILALRRHAFTHTPHRGASPARGGAWELLRQPELRRVFLVTAMLASAWDLFMFVLPIYGTEIGLSASTIGFILGSFAAATILVRLALPWISRHLREWTMITTTMCVACVAFALFPLSQAVSVLAATAFLLGLGLGATQPSVMSLIYAAAPPGRAGEAVGVRSVVMNVSHTFLPLAFGGLGAALGITPIFWSMSAALAGGGWLANRQRRRAEKGR